MKPTGVMAVVSLQTVPILQLLWHLQSTLPTLQCVILLHTSDDEESAGPALRVQQLWNDSFSIPCEILEIGILPQEVRHIIRVQQEKHPEIERWIVSGTGGLTLMTLGMGDAWDDHTEIRYAESQQGWYRVVKDSTGFFVGERLVEQPPVDVADSIPVERLVSTQRGNFNRVPKPLPLNALVEDLPRLTKELIETGWSWAPVRARLASGWKDRRNGTCFELYVAACLHAMGIPNLAWSLATELRRNRVLENDLLAWHHGRLIVLDLKLDKGGASFVQQVRLANQAQHDLSGLGAEWVLLRPTLRFPPEWRNILEAFGIHFWLDITRAKYLISHLQGWLGGQDLPEVRALLEASDKPFITR